MPQQLALNFPSRTAMGRDDFMVAPSNAVAVSWLDLWPHWPASALIIYGPDGCGKTHLAHVWQAQSQAHLISRVDVTEESVPSLLTLKAPLIVDDADARPRGAAAERALFHLYNAQKEAGHQILFLSKKAPNQWGVRLPDLRSRLYALPTAAVEAPDDALLAAVFVKLFADRQLNVGTDIIDYALRYGERSFAAARALVDTLDRVALSQHRRITVPLVKEILSAPNGTPRT